MKNMNAVGHCELISKQKWNKPTFRSGGYFILIKIEIASVIAALP